MHTIKVEKPTEWMLVKVPRIINKETGADATASMLREAIRDEHFGGDCATVRRLTRSEIAAIKSARDSRPRLATPAAPSGEASHSDTNPEDAQQDPDEFECCGNPVVGAEYMGAREMVCCGNPEPRGERAQQPIDPLQGAANWLREAIFDCGVGDLQRNLLIGYNRAKRLFDASTQDNGADNHG